MTMATPRPWRLDFVALRAHLVARREVRQAEVIRPHVLVALDENQSDLPEGAVGIARGFPAPDNARAKRGEVLDQARPPWSVAVAACPLHVGGAGELRHLGRSKPDEGGAAHDIARRRLRVRPRVGMQSERDRRLELVDALAADDRMVRPEVGVAGSAQEGFTVSTL